MLKCTQCQTIGDESTHFIRKTPKGPVPFAKCKKCHNAPRLKGRTGAAAVPADQALRIKLALLDRRNTIRGIARAEGIPNTTLTRWLKSGSLVDNPFALAAN
jgi:DNA invertase Pin-like site-specific DNA recombinase